MPQPSIVSTSQGGLTVKAYGGDGGVLLAFDLDSALTANFAGFAIKCTPPGGSGAYVPNRLNFSTPVTSATTPAQRVWTPSDQAPIQKFRWVHYPSALASGAYTYEITAMLFQAGSTALKSGPSVEVSLPLIASQFGKFEFGFTRGYLSSQAYAAQFKNAPILPTPKTVDFNTTPYEVQYAWLGGHARRMVFTFLQECVSDPQLTVDLFAYDLDEPDFLRGLQQLKGRLRAFLDDAPLHTKPGAMEIQSKALLLASAGTANVKTGHFQRFAHNKVMIQKRNGVPTKVLTGSANFSDRGLYVQANNVLVFDDPSTAALYEEAFNQAWSDMSGFANSQIAEGWNDLTAPGLPPASVCFSPHKTADVSLTKPAQAIQGAKSSVLFAIMELAGSGAVLDDVKALGSREDIFSYGVTQTLTGLNLYKPGADNALVVPFGYLKSQVPAPFQQEWDGGMGQVIHDKFIVLDFNDLDPVVFTGSSNLAAGGEEANGDNLIAISDPSIVVAYAVEAIRLVDHYHFRAAMNAATAADPLILGGPDSKWWAPYYDPKDIRSRERVLFSK